jgi:molecular chaperone Hsp33
MGAMSAIPIGDDLLRPFQLERTALRGRVVRLGEVLDRVLTRHDYPEPVSRLLGELFVLAATLAGGLKYPGSFGLQVKSDGPVSLMLADCTNDGAMRGYARFDPDQVESTSDDLGGLLGTGHLALTVDRSETGQTYQGIVELTGGNLTQCMQTYFRQSEQLQTGLRIAVERVADPVAGPWRAGGIMVQPLPDQLADQLDPDQVTEDWRRTMLHLATATDAELTDPHLPAESLLWRLFHEEGVRVFRPVEFSFRCRCTRARVETMLRSFPIEELQEMRRDDGTLVVTCQFCNAAFEFDEAELARLHAGTEH